MRTGAPELELPANTYDDEVKRLKNWIAIRLNWLDKNMVGSGDNCDALAVEEVDMVKLRLFPNPAQTYLYVEAVQSVDKVEIFDPMGKKYSVFKGKKQYSHKIDVSYLSPGLYFVRMTLGDSGIIKVKKLLIE